MLADPQPSMYRVVGCRDCGALWIVADRPETTTCPRCDTRHSFERLHAFAETEAEAAAREARAALLADRAGQGDAFDDLDVAVAEQLDFEAIPDVSHLEAAGLDPDAVAEAGDRATAGPASGPSHREVVLRALEALDRPTEPEVIEYARERDVPGDTARSLLDRLVRAGEVSRSAGRYRRL